MASLALKRVLSSSLFSSPVRAASSHSRFIKTMPAPPHSDSNDSNEGLTIEQINTRNDCFATLTPDGLLLEVYISKNGLKKDDLRVLVEHDNLIVEVKRKDSDRVRERFYAPATLYKLIKIKAKYENGVFNLFAPSYKEGEKRGDMEVEVKW